MSPAAIKHTYMSSREVRDIGPNVTKFLISREFFFVKVHNTKFHRNPSSARSADICGRTDRQKDSRLTDMTNVIGALSDSAKTSKNEGRIYRSPAFLSNSVLFFL